MDKNNWKYKPFPYLIIDNFLSDTSFQRLKKELNENINIKQKTFFTPLENKTIYRPTQIKKETNYLIDLMASEYVKDLISEKIGDFNILSMGETKDYSGYSPYHITQNGGFLGSHIDHSYIQNGDFCHIANTIFYASNSWEKEWGGETILFSKHGYHEKVLIDPIPNRLIIFFHTSNSFHGVKEYNSNLNIERRTFYHDYYVKKSEVKYFINNLNKKYSLSLKYRIHTTTFIPFFPFGFKNVKLKTILDIKNFNYINGYLIYIFNYIFKKELISFKYVIRPFLKLFRKKF